MNVTIEIDDTAVRDALKGVETQAPFALSLAVNNVTKDAQAAIRRGYAERFTLRRPDFITREGAKIIQFATKAKPDAILAVTERAQFLVKHEAGGEHRPRDGRAIAIPINVRRNKSDIIPKAQRPKALYASKAAAAGRVFSKAGLLIQKVGRGARATTRVLYKWASSVTITPALRFTQTANATVDRQWRDRALEAVDRALASMK